jgi:hypothetical protein
MIEVIGVPIIWAAREVEEEALLRFAVGIEGGPWFLIVVCCVGLGEFIVDDGLD